MEESWSPCYTVDWAAWRGVLWDDHYYVCCSHLCRWLWPAPGWRRRRCGHIPVNGSRSRSCWLWGLDRAWVGIWASTPCCVQKSSIWSGEWCGRNWAESWSAEVTNATSDRFQIAMGLDGYFRNDERDRRGGVAEGIASGCAVRVAIVRCRAAGGPDVSEIAKGTDPIDRLSDWGAEVLRSAAGPLTRDEFSAEGLADP